MALDGFDKDVRMLGRKDTWTVSTHMSLLGHDFQETLGRSAEPGDNPHETVKLLRCKWCNQPPRKAREDGCPINELETNGKIILSQFNPKGVAYFHSRKCVTCDGPIMGHHLRRGSPHYWCSESQYSEGIDNCVYDVQGVVVPQDPQCPPQ